MLSGLGGVYYDVFQRHRSQDRVHSPFAVDDIGSNAVSCAIVAF